MKVVYRCFELNPAAPKDITENYYEIISKKYGISVQQAKTNAQNVQQMAQSAGLEFNMDTMILTNTFDAHRLAMFANRFDLMHEMTERILRAYYSESKHIGDHGTLIELAEEVGLQREAVASMLSSMDMSDEVRADEKEANDFGIHSIPFFLINRKYAITGAQSSEVFVDVLNQIK